MLPHLQRLEAESIHILREVVAECERPVTVPTRREPGQGDGAARTVK